VRVVILGGGRVGWAIARDLSPDFKVTVADVSDDALRRAKKLRVDAVRADLSTPEGVAAVIRTEDLVVCAVPGAMGYATLRAIINAGKPAVDISFFPEDPFTLRDLAREKGVTAVVDCGVAPGLSNMTLGYWTGQLDRVFSYRCDVGGLPQQPEPPWDYRAPFSPADVIEEYTREVRIRRDGQDLVLPALSERELIEFRDVGLLESFNTDGLRTLLHTTAVPSLLERTLRYPGHVERITVLRDSGFFDTEPVRVGDRDVRPLDVTSALLFEQWAFRPGERDLTVMRIAIEGEYEKAPVQVTYDLLDRFDEETGVPSMSRTTGYTCTGVVRLLAAGAIQQTGMVTPEEVGGDAAAFKRILQHLSERGVELKGESSGRLPAAS
jgi:saccharopine dehydrogenase-like NADP-dependent oxidoreductase